MNERAAAALVILSLLGCGRSEAVAAKSDEAPANTKRSEPSIEAARQFVLSSDPNEPIVRVTYGRSALLGLPAPTYTLYGDGRLEVAKSDTRQDPKAPPPAPESVVVDADELHALGELAANPLLIEGNREALATEFDRAGSLMRDGSVVTVDVRLASYSRAGVALGPVARTFKMVDPQLAAQHQLGGEAVQALAALVNGITRLYYDTKEEAQ